MHPEPPAIQSGSAASRVRRFWPLALGLLTGVAFRLIFRGNTNGAFDVMMASFTLLVPVAIAIVTVLAASDSQKRSWSFCFWTPVAANALFVFGTFIVLIEGLICTVLAVPLFSLIGGLAGLLTGACYRLAGRSSHSLLSIAAMPLLTGGLEQHVPLPQQVDSVTASLVTDATPDLLWRVLINTGDIRPEEMENGWMYRIGVPLPRSALTQMINGQAVRHIEMGKNIRFDQVAVDWHPGERVRWTYRLDDESFPARALDEHVRIGGKYFDLIDTEYVLEPLNEGTQITATMRYRVSTHFNWYARLIARLLVGNFESTALNFYARRALADPDRTPLPP